MKLKFLSLVLILLASQLVWGQAKEGCAFEVTPDWGRFNFNGKVKSAITYKIDHLPKWGRPYVGKREFYEEILFDSNGELSKYKDWMPRLSSTATERQLTPICDLKNRIIAVRMADKDGRSFDQTVIKYNENGLISEQSEYFPTGILETKQTHRYDTRGNIIETITTTQVHPEHFSPKRYDVYVTTKAEFDHDDRKNVIETRTYRGDGSFYAKWLYVYDKNNRLLKETRIDDKGRAVDLEVYKYDSKGLIEKIHYQNFCYTKNDELCDGSIKMPEGNFYYVTKETYENDRHGNWVKKFEYHMGGEEKSAEYKISAVYDRIIRYL